jgi:hypothetical protein
MLIQSRSRFLIAVVVALTGPQLILRADDVIIKTGSASLVVLPKGKVHEAFVSPENYCNDPPHSAPKAPPGELAEVRPEISADLATKAIWIPGYWTFDGTADNFIWTSGVWRFPPPGFRWNPGKWERTENGFVRVSGQWVPKDLEKVIYVQSPPRYQGPFLLPSSLPKDQFWVPGAWVAKGDKFEWRAGFVSRRIEKWVWVPAQYTWAPEGWFFVDGHWDYPLASRGQSFASLKPTTERYDAAKTRVDKFVPIPTSAIKESDTGEFVYDVKVIEQDSQLASLEFVDAEVPVLPIYTETVLPERPVAVVRGTAYRGSLTPANIDVELIGHKDVVVKTDAQGRFEFADVPFGIYYIRAAGPVQNYVRKAYGRVEVSKPVADLKIELQ